MLDLEAKLFNELFPDFQGFILRRFTQYQFHTTAASQGYSMDRKSTLALILGCPLLICTKFKVQSRQQFVQNQLTRQLTKNNLSQRVFTWNVASASTEV